MGEVRGGLEVEVRDEAGFSEYRGTVRPATWRNMLALHDNMT